MLNGVSNTQPTLFTGFKIESNSDDEIWLEVNLDSLLKVLRSADSSGTSLSNLFLPACACRTREAAEDK